MFMEWNKNKYITKLKDSTLYPSHTYGFGICVFFWTLVGAVRQYNIFTCHYKISYTTLQPMTEHYSWVLVPSDFAHLYNHKRITSGKTNKIWFKQGSGYHAISIHAELFSSYSLHNQILLYEMQHGTKKIFVLHLDWPPHRPRRETWPARWFIRV